MISSRAPQNRLLLGAWLAALSILANAALHGSWAQEMPVAGSFGGSFSICLAHGGSNDASPAEKGDSTGSATSRCELCVIPASFAVPASHTGPTTVVFQNISDAIYGYDAPRTLSQGPGLQFDARGPPV